MSTAWLPLLQNLHDITLKHEDEFTFSSHVYIQIYVSKCVRIQLTFYHRVIRKYLKLGHRLYKNCMLNVSKEAHPDQSQQNRERQVDKGTDTVAQLWIKSSDKSFATRY
jgi:hypothetical protein